MRGFGRGKACRCSRRGARGGGATRPDSSSNAYQPVHTHISPCVARVVRSAGLFSGPRCFCCYWLLGQLTAAPGFGFQHATRSKKKTDFARLRGLRAARRSAPCVPRLALWLGGPLACPEAVRRFRGGVRRQDRPTGGLFTQRPPATSNQRPVHSHSPQALELELVVEVVEKHAGLCFFVTDITTRFHSSRSCTLHCLGSPRGWQFCSWGLLAMGHGGSEVPDRLGESTAALGLRRKSPLRALGKVSFARPAPRCLGVREGSPKRTMWPWGKAESRRVADTAAEAEASCRSHARGSASPEAGGLTTAAVAPDAVAT